MMLYQSDIQTSKTNPKNSFVVNRCTGRKLSTFPTCFNNIAVKIVANNPRICYC